MYSLPPTDILYLYLYCFFFFSFQTLQKNIINFTIAEVIFFIINLHRIDYYYYTNIPVFLFFFFFANIQNISLQVFPQGTYNIRNDFSNNKSFVQFNQNKLF